MCCSRIYYIKRNVRKMYVKAARSLKSLFMLDQATELSANSQTIYVYPVPFSMIALFGLQVLHFWK